MKKFLALTVLTMTMVLTGIHANADDIHITPINEINSSPANFDGKEVRLKGIAKDATRIPLINLKSYVLQDNSGEITILTEADLPQMGEEISIRARVDSLAIILGEAIGMTVIELERYQLPIGIKQL